MRIINEVEFSFRRLTEIREGHLCIKHTATEQAAVNSGEVASMRFFCHGYAFYNEVKLGIWREFSKNRKRGFLLPLCYVDAHFLSFVVRICKGFHNLLFVAFVHFKKGEIFHHLNFTNFRTFVG